MDVVSVKLAEWQSSGRKEYRLWEMLVFGNEVDYRVYGESEEEALRRAQEKFGEMIAKVIKVEGQLDRMEYDEEEY